MLSECCPKKKPLEEVQFSQLNCNAARIAIIDRVPTSVCFITKLYLNNNQLISLHGIEQFNNLEVLSFNFNHVSVFSHLERVKNKFFIRELSYIGNPIEADSRSEISYIRNNLFHNLRALNDLEGIHLSSKAKNHTNIQSSIQRSTSRFRHCKIQQLSRKTKRTHQSPIQKLSASSESLEIFKPKFNEGSTGYGNVTLPTYQHHPHAQSCHEEIDVKPFLQNKDQSFGSQELEGTARFPEKQSKASYKQQVSLAVWHLNEQKDQIASAFRRRYLKEKIFSFMKHKLSKEKCSAHAQLRRSWVKLRVEAAIRGILDEYRGWV